MGSCFLPLSTLADEKADNSCREWWEKGYSERSVQICRAFTIFCHHKYTYIHVYQYNCMSVWLDSVLEIGINSFLQVLCADNFCKQFGPSSGWMKHLA